MLLLLPPGRDCRHSRPGSQSERGFGSFCKLSFGLLGIVVLLLDNGMLWPLVTSLLPGGERKDVVGVKGGDLAASKKTLYTILEVFLQFQGGTISFAMLWKSTGQTFLLLAEKMCHFWMVVRTPARKSHSSTSEKLIKTKIQQKLEPIWLKMPWIQTAAKLRNSGGKN